ncbi:MAG: M1 family metallopeptidase [Candidatus Binatia bacterium]
MRLRMSLLLLGACAMSPMTQPKPEDSLDRHSFARPAEVRTTHLELALELDFAAHVATGTARHTLRRADAAAPFVLDTQDLAILGVEDERGAPLSFELAAADAILGRRLSVQLGRDTRTVAIRYRTSPDAAALQWLLPAQTSGGVKPFLFTQGQAILTRSWIPLQDSPAVRITWSAEITAPRDMVVVMSASERNVRQDGDKGVTSFRLDKPVPSYLIALAAGDLGEQAISQRCAVWAETPDVARAAAELSDMEAMVQACEQLFGAYRWGRYDVIVLPPSFPFGGMENPCLTFATPTILAGDKSLVSLIAHELAHSWSGNLVTNATWRDFWLNEGFTVYLERRIMEHVYGRDRAAMENALGMQDLREEMATLPAGDQVLHIDLAGRNPDDGMTDVPYEKGAAFLRRLEQAFGRERLDAFLRQWFDEHAFQSTTTAVFLAFLRERLFALDPGAAAAIDIERWIRGSGLPADAPEPRSALFDAADREAARWRAGASAGELVTTGWVTQQWLRFLNALEADGVDRLAELDAACAFTASGNSEILAAWLEHAVRCGYRAVDARLEQFLLTVGRRKFLKPLYEAVLATPGGKERALALYARARPRYHAVSQRTLDAMLGYEQ